MTFKPGFSNKVKHVLSAPNSAKNHHCHWTGCTTKVKPAMWGCKRHWFALPEYLRKKIWATYTPGQEETKTPSKEYVVVALEVQAWIKENQK